MKNNQTHKGLGIPEGYFSKLRENILEEIECLEFEKEIEKKFGRSPGLSVPPNYFNEFSVEVHQTKSSTRVRSILITSISVAAILAVALLFSQLDTSDNLSDIPVKSFNDLLAEIDISDEHLEYLDIEELTSIYTEINYMNSAGSESSSESLEYLLEDDDFLDELINELDNI